MVSWCLSPFLRYSHWPWSLRGEGTGGRSAGTGQWKEAGDGVAATLPRATGVAERDGLRRPSSGLGAAWVQVSAMCTSGSGSQAVGDTL